MRTKMHETYYRASRVCRVLGNPTAYQIIRNLQGKEKTPYQLAEEMGISLALGARYGTKTSPYFKTDTETSLGPNNLCVNFSVGKVRHIVWRVAV